MHLTREEQREESQPREGEGGVARGEGAPAVVQLVEVGLHADFPGDEGVGGGALDGLAARDQVGAGAPDGVLDEVGDEAGEEHADEEGEEGDVVFMEGGAGDEKPHQYEDERDDGAVYVHHYCADISGSSA